MHRVLKKGRSFEPREMSPEVYRVVEFNLPLGVDAAIEKGREAVIAEQRTYLADLALGVQRGTVTKERFAYETGRIAAEGIVLKRSAEDADVFPTAKDVKDYLLRTYPPKDLGWVADCTWKAEVIPLTKIDSTPPSGGLDQDTIAAQVEGMKAGKTIHPIVVVMPPGGSLYVIADGHHRVSAAFTANRDSIEAWVGEPGKDADWQEAVVQMQHDRMDPKETDVEKSRGNAVVVNIPDDVRIAPGDTIDVVWEKSNPEPPAPPETMDEPHVTTRTPEDIAEDERRVKDAEEAQRADPDAEG